MSWIWRTFKKGKIVQGGWDLLRGQKGVISSERHPKSENRVMTLAGNSPGPFSHQKSNPATEMKLVLLPSHIFICGRSENLICRKLRLLIWIYWMGLQNCSHISWSLYQILLTAFVPQTATSSTPHSMRYANPLYIRFT